MICRRLEWRNFRNLKPQRLEWAEGLQLLFGENAAGKTNSLETIHMLTGWGPFRNTRINDLSNWKNESGESFIRGTFEGEERAEVAVGISKKTRMRCNGRGCRATDLRMKIPSLSFLPEDMSLVEGSPSVRRRFLDKVCALLFPVYAPRLHEYRRAVRQRTAALRRARGVSAASRAMAPLAAWIWSARSAAVDLVSLGMEEFERLMPAKISLSLSRGGSSGMEDGLEDFWKGIYSESERESRLGSCIVGPHRDDMLAVHRDRPASESFSRGHRRRMAVAMMLAAGWAVERKTRRKPLLLLDEVMAELDMDGRTRMTEALQESSWQVFVTTAEECMPRWPGTIWRVKDGEIFPERD